MKQHTRRNAVLVGFGISIPDDARTYVKDADGVIIGSALIKRIANGVAGRELSSWIREMKTALA